MQEELKRYEEAIDQIHGGIQMLVTMLGEKEGGGALGEHALLTIANVAMAQARMIHLQTRVLMQIETHLALKR